MARSKWDKDNPINLLKRIDEHQAQIEELEKVTKALAGALLESAKEIRINREFIGNQADLSRRTVEALEHLKES
jgi:hypothetical protein